jgi:putative transcription antitermination factor YqgF
MRFLPWSPFQLRRRIGTVDMARILGLDVGDRRVGVAVSDELGLTAQPVLTLVRKNQRQDLGSLRRLVRKYGCNQVVVGNPLYMSGDVSPQALKAQALALDLQSETGVSVTLVGRTALDHRGAPAFGCGRPPAGETARRD